MSVTTCIATHLSSKSPIAAYRAELAEDVAELVDGGMTTDAAWLKVAGDKLTELKSERTRIEQVVADAYAKTAAGKVEAPVAEPEAAVQAPQAAATHTDPGEAPEAVTPAVVAEAVKTAAENRDRKPSAMRAELLAMIDAKMADAKGADDQDVMRYEERGRAKPDRTTLMRRYGRSGRELDTAIAAVQSRIDMERESAAKNIGFVTFRVPGDGMFKVVNTKDRLAAFRRTVEASPGFKDRQPAQRIADAGDGDQRGSGGPKAAIANMIDDGDPQAAVDYAAARGLDIAEVLKGDKVRLPKVAGLMPTEAEAVGEFEPEAQAEAQPEQPATEDDEAPKLTEAQARKQFEWRDMGQKDGTKTHRLFFFVKPEDKGTGAAMGRGYVELYEGSSGWRVDGEGESFKALADAKKAAVEAAIPVLREQGWIEPAAETAAQPVAEAKQGKIEDVGEKIGGARKDVADRGYSMTKRGEKDDRPTWAKRFKIAQIVKAAGQVGDIKDEGRWTIRDSRSLDWSGQPKQVGRNTFATQEEAEAYVPLAAVGLKHRVIASGRTADAGDKYEIWRDITDRKRVKVVEQQFDSRDDAMRYMLDNAAAIIETNTTFGEADLPLPPDRQRVGPERRTGELTANDFKQTFGFRGVEFGNWNNQAERQALVNDAWDGLMDLADVLGIPPKALSLNGDLALAFGARGNGLQSARAHYERDRAVINLTKERGAGSLAHEWFHGLDHYFGRQDGKASAAWKVLEDGTRTLIVKGAEEDMASGGFRNQSGVRPEVRAAYETVLRTMTKRAENYVEDVAKLDKFTGKTREDLAQQLDSLRKELSAQKDEKYYKRNNKPASAEQLAEFDSIAKAMIEGDVAAVTTDWRLVRTAKDKGATRWTNDSLERLSAIYKAVRGRSGFDATNSNGLMDRLRGYMDRYSQRMKMLADAQKTGGEKTRMVPTEFARDARELDQGRSGDYWTTPHEMAARAFQGYVEDKIGERGGVSRFLNYAPENAGILTPWGVKRPYPAGQERIAINKAFDALISTIETRETDSGTAMFSIADNDNARGAADEDRKGFWARLDRLRDGLAAARIGDEIVRPGGLRVGRYAGVQPASIATGLESKFDMAGLDRSDAKADTASYEPAGNRHTELVARIAARINRNRPAAQRYMLDAVAVRPGSTGARSRELAAVTSVAKRFFGHEVVFVKFTGKPLFNGMVDHGIPGVVFVNADSQRPMMAVLGHELLHKLRNNNPELYRDFVRRIGRVTKNAPDYAFDLEKKYDAANFPMPDDWVEELHADMVGDFFTDPQFWQDMAADQPGLFKRLANAILKFLDDVAEHLKGNRTFGTDRYLTDINAARAAVVSAMRDYSTAQNKDMASEVEGIRLSQADRQDQTDTPAFRKWFGDSKVVDAEGKPLVVYHGTEADFAEFRPGRGDLGQGIYFASAPDDAASYVSMEGRGANLMPVYVKIENPYYWTKEDRNKSADAVNKAARKAGHDGIIRTWAASDERHFIAFRPEQIKSAIGNRGTFDPTNPDIRLSIADTLQDTPPERAVRTAQDLVNTKGGVFDFNRLGETKQDRLRTVMDGSRPFWLGALTRDQIADIYGKEIAPVKDYDELTRAMENERSKMAGDADTLYTEWAKLDQKDNDRLARIMLDGTVHQVHPDRAFEPNPGGENDDERRRVHGMISTQYKLLPPEAKAMYGKVRDFHLDTLTKLRDALEARIERQVEGGNAKAAALTSIRTMFDKYLGSGPYFPLSRFGDFLVVAKREDGERVVASYATAGEQQAAARKLESDGFTVKMKTAKTYSRETDGAAGKFIGDVLTAVDKLDMDDATVGGQAADLKNKLLDDINQMFIKALPDLSYRKHFMHRKGTPGFSSDVMRGFASSAFHAASHIARLNHGDKMTFALQDAYTQIEQAPDGDFNQASQVLNELTKRHDAAMNPNTHPIAAMLNQVGFIMYLGLSPAAGLVNMLQTVMVTMPHLGARYGFGKANGSLATAYADILAAPVNAKNGWNAAQSQKLTQTERAMMSQLQDEGVIDLTQAHDLASATNLDTGNVARSKAAFAMSRAMKIVGWTFHIPEVMNRQVTALSAYRLEMEKSGDEDAAKDAAREAIKRTHFDYSSSNRARFMSGNLARVVTQFKQYSQNMTYLLGRAAHQALKGESPEVRAIARRQLVATLGVTFGMAGALGLPGLGSVMGLIGLLAGAMDDDDEPWDWKVEFRNLMADSFGKEAGEVIAHGIPRALMPWDISSRVGLGDLWWRDSGREGQNPREAFAADMQNILGPTAGTLMGLYTAADHMARGNWSKATESIVPKALRDPLKAIREAQDGMTNYNGEPLMDVGAAEIAGRALGFAPARGSEMFEARNAVKNAETVLNEKRQRLLSRMVKARMDLDTVLIVDLQDDINEFNQRNPEFRITSDSIMKSVRAKRRNVAETEDGIRLPKGKQSLREMGRFAEVD